MEWQLVNFCFVSYIFIIHKHQTPGNPLPWHHSSPVLLKNCNILLHSEFWLKATHVTAFCIHILAVLKQRRFLLRLLSPAAFSTASPHNITGNLVARCRLPKRWLMSLPKKKNRTKKGFANGFAAPISSKKCLNAFAFLGQPFEKIQRKLEKAERAADHKFQVFPLSHLLIKFLL